LALVADEYKLAVGGRIKERREALGMTQKQLADAMHYKEGQTVSRWERGENLPADLSVVAAALQWTVEQLMRGVDPPNARKARNAGVALPQPDETSPQLDHIEDVLERLVGLLEGQHDAIAGLTEQLDALAETRTADRRESVQAIQEAFEDYASRLAERIGKRPPRSKRNPDPPPGSPEVAA
jgi:transcriptional regulator with XRE-family HTH domain